MKHFCTLVLLFVFTTFSLGGPVPFSTLSATETGRRMASIFLFEDSYSQKESDKIVPSIVSYLGKIKTYDYYLTESEIYAEVNSERDEFALGLRIYEKAVALYENLDIESAILRFESAQEIMEKHTNHLAEIKPLSNLMLYMGASYKLLDNEEKSKQYFVSYLSINPNASLDTRIFSPDIVDFFNNIKTDFQMLPNGSVSFSSNPSGAIVFLDGKVVGVTPLTVNGITEGKHYYRIHMNGYKDKGNTLKVKAQKMTNINEFLDQQKKADLFIANKKEMIQSYGTENFITKALETGEDMDVDKLFVSYISVHEGVAASSFYLIDVNDKSYIDGVFDISLPFNEESEFGLLDEMDSFFDMSKTPKTILISEKETPKDEEPKDSDDDGSILSTWWFWTIVGTSVAAAAGTTTYFLLQDDENSGSKLEINIK